MNEQEGQDLSRKVRDIAYIKSPSLLDSEYTFEGALINEYGELAAQFNVDQGRYEPSYTTTIDIAWSELSMDAPALLEKIVADRAEADRLQKIRVEAEYKERQRLKEKAEREQYETLKRKFER